MAQTITWSAQIDVAAGPRLPANGSIDVEAYDRIAITLEAGAAGVDVELQPGGAGQVVLLMVKASEYDPAITYSADGGGTAFALDAPLILIGAGAIDLLGGPPNTFQWDNGTVAAVHIDIFIGRKATP